MGSNAKPLQGEPNDRDTVLNTVQTSVGWHFVSGSVRGFQPLYRLMNEVANALKSDLDD